MKKLLMFALIIFLNTTGVFAEKFTVTRNFQQPEIKSEERGFSRIIYPGCHNYGNEGAPLLPYYGVDLLLPQNQEIISVKIISVTYYPVIDNIKIIPAERQFPISEIKNHSGYTAIPDTKIYSSSQSWPSDIAGKFRTSFLSGHSVGAFTVCPVIFFPSLNQVKLIKEITIEVETQSTTKSAAASAMLRKSPSVENRLRHIV